MKASTLKINLLSSKTQLGRVAQLAKELGCPVFVDLNHGHYYSHQDFFSKPYISLDSDDISSLLEGVLYLLHELGHHMEVNTTGIADTPGYGFIPEDVICCEILAWANGIYLAKSLGIPLMKGYKDRIKYCLYSYCGLYHKDFNSLDSSTGLNAFRVPHHPGLKRQVDLFLERL